MITCGFSDEKKNNRVQIIRGSDFRGQSREKPDPGKAFYRQQSVPYLARSFCVFSRGPSSVYSCVSCPGPGWTNNP